MSVRWSSKNNFVHCADCTDNKTCKTYRKRQTAGCANGKKVKVQ